MRILFATRDFPPDAVGGTEIYTYMLAACLKELGHDVSVLCVGRWVDDTNYFNGTTTEAYKGLEVTRLHLNWQLAPDPNRYLYRSPVAAEQMSRHLARQRPDIVHVTSCDRLSASIIPAVKQAGIPVILSLTDFWFLCPRWNLVRSDGRLCRGQTSSWDCLRCMVASANVYRWPAEILPETVLRVLFTAVSRQAWITRQRGLRGMAFNMTDRKDFLTSVLRQADFVTIATPFGAGLFSEVVPGRQIHVTPYGHDLSWLQNYRGKTPSDALRIGYIAHLHEPKGPQLLIQAFRQLPRSRPLQLLLYGRAPEGAFSQYLHALASGDPRIRFCGCYSHESSAEIYSNMDILAIPSLWYDFPLVAHEALATGTVVVATDIPGLNEIVEDEVSGLLFERGNVGALATQLRRLLETPDLIERLRRTKRTIRSIEDAVAELDGIYTRLVAKAGAGGDRIS